MIAIKEENSFEYTVDGYFMDQSLCGSFTAYGLEDAIETARVEWCEEQDSANIYDEERRLVAEIDRYGRIYLAAGIAWEIEIA